MTDVGRGLRILVIDDDVDLLRAYHLVLGSLHRVVSVTTAEAALSILERDEDFDMILCDQQLPSMTGAGLLLDLRCRRPALSTRFVLASSEEALARSLGCRLMHKPFTLTELRGLIDATERR